jgi:hypothetical protein
MDHRKLFHVLVVGGAMLGLGCRDEDRTETSSLADGGDEAPDAGKADDGTLADASTASDAGGDGDAGSPAEIDAGNGTADAGPLEECGFCPNDLCCVDDGTGSLMVRDGFACCWGTSC